MKTTNRGKAAWAARRAAEARQQADELAAQPYRDWRDRQRRDETVRRLRAEAHRFGVMASRYRDAA